MANAKISALTSATTPLAGTETVPIVQSSTTKKVAVSDLTAGRAVSAASLALTTSPLPATSGGTGSASAFSSRAVSFASSTSALSTSTSFTYDTSGNLLVGNTGSAFAPSNAILQGYSFQINSISGSVASGGTLALWPGANRIVGFLTVANVNSASANVRTQTTYSVFILDGDNTSIQQIATATGTGGGSAFTIAWVNGTGFVLTNTSGAARTGYMWLSGQYIG
jgi:hypothetical protein